MEHNEARTVYVVRGDASGQHESLGYTRLLKQLTELKHADVEEVKKADAAAVVDQFLSSTSTGVAFGSGVRSSVELILQHELSSADVDVGVKREPMREITEWFLGRSTSPDFPELSSDAFEYCLSRREWTTLLRRAVVQDEHRNGLSDEQLQRLADGPLSSEEVLAFIDIFETLDQHQEARNTVERYFTSRTDHREPAQLLRRAIDLAYKGNSEKFDEQVTERVTASLRQWTPNDNETELELLASLGCERGCYDEVLLAVTRWLRHHGEEPCPKERRDIVARGIEALLEREGRGDVEAIAMYRRHLSSDTHYGIEGALYRAAVVAGDTQLTEDLLDSCVSHANQRQPIDEELQAEADERDGRFDTAFDVWTRRWESDNDETALERMIKNRLLAGDPQRANGYIDELPNDTRRKRYQVQTESARRNFREVIALVETDETLLESTGESGNDIGTAYVEALVSLGRWDELASHFDGRSTTEREYLYEQLTELELFITDESDRFTEMEAVDQVERLLSEQMPTQFLEQLLELNTVGRLFDRVSSGEAKARVEVATELFEILISLHAERLLDTLPREDADQFKTELEEMSFGQGSSRLLGRLRRRATESGTQINDNY